MPVVRDCESARLGREEFVSTDETLTARCSAGSCGIPHSAEIRPDVVEDGVVKKHSVLRHHANCRSQRRLQQVQSRGCQRLGCRRAAIAGKLAPSQVTGVRCIGRRHKASGISAAACSVGHLRHVADVLAVDGDPARCRVVEAEQQPQAGALAAARRADQGQGAAAAGRHADVLQHRGAGVVLCVATSLLGVEPFSKALQHAAGQGAGRTLPRQLRTSGPTTRHICQYGHSVIVLH